MEFPVAHKTGALDALRSDVGIVYSKAGKIAMAVTVDDMAKPDWSPDNPGSLLIADLAKTLVDGLVNRSLR
jgi:beta-lactamase class A